MPRRTLFLAVAAAVAVVLGAAVIGNPFVAKSAAIMLKPDDSEVLALGEKVYRTQCAACHGSHLEGQPNWRERGADGLLPAPPHDASGHTWHHPDDLLFRITKHGVAKAANLNDYRSAMPVYEGVLSDDEIVAALSWIKAQWPPKVRAQHDQMNARNR